MNAWPRLDELLTELGARGYDDAFDAAAAGLRARGAERVFEPEQLAVDEMTRVDHPFDPDHDRLVFALHVPGDGVRGVYAAPCRAAAASDDARMIERLRRQAPAAPGDHADRFRPDERRTPARGVDAERQLCHWQSSFLLGFLELLDDVDRTLRAADAARLTDGIRDGLALIQRRFVSKLAEHGVRRVEPHGERFDPRRDEAASRVAVAPDQDGIVVDVVAPGYTGKDGVLRPALVVVGQAATEPPATD